FPSPTPHHDLTTFLLSSPAYLLSLHSFPTRRSSDLDAHLSAETSKPLFLSAEQFAALDVLSEAIVPGSRKYVQRRELFCGQEKRSEEHTSELQSRFDLVCRLLLEKKNRNDAIHTLQH